LHTADYRRAAFRKFGDGWLRKHLRKFSGVPQYKAGTFTDQKLYHLRNNSKFLQQASCKRDLTDLVPGGVTTVRLMDPECPLSSQG